MVALVNLDLAKLHLRTEDDEGDYDDLIEAYIEAAVAWVEDYTGLVLSPDPDSGTGRVQTFDDFMPALRLFAWPIRDIISIEYIDRAGASQSLAPEQYRITMAQRPARLSPSIGGCWPQNASVDQAITVTFRAGFEANTVPASINTAILMMVDHFFRNRASVEVGDRAAAIEVPLGVRDLLSAWRITSV